jgi:lysophospholipase L1-like esterase
MFPDRQIEVINAGHNSFTISDLLELLRQRVLPLQPDIILFYEAKNNIQFSEFLRDAPMYCPGHCWIDSRWKRFLYYNSGLFNLMADRFGWINIHPAPMQHTFDDTLPKPSVERYRKGLEEIVREAQSHRIRIVLSSFITFAYDGLQVSYEDYPELAAQFERQHYPYTPGEVARIYQVFNQQSAEVAREFNVPYADVAADFRREPRYFFHDLVHLNPDGYRLLAHQFAEFLGESVLPQLMDDRH